MTLHFLDFDYSEDDEGTATWDAIASVPAHRLPQLQDEVAAVLAWAHGEFGALRGPVEDGGLWDYDLHCERDGQPLLTLAFEPRTGQLLPPTAAQPGERVTLTLTINGAAAFAEAFTARFGVA